MGYLLIAVENVGSFYTFSFESAPLLPRRFYVFRQDDIGKWGAHGRSPKEIAEEEISPYCAEIFKCSDSCSFVAEIQQDVPDDVISKTVERRMRNTAKYHVELLVTWLLLPVICLIVVTVTNTPWEWGNKTAYAMHAADVPCCGLNNKLYTPIKSTRKGAFYLLQCFSFGSI